MVSAQHFINEAPCVHIWFVSCPCFMSLWVKYVPAVFMWLCVNNPVYLVPVFWVWFQLVYSLLPGVSCLWVLPCPALMSLNIIIWVYVLVSVFLFLPRVCTVTICGYARFINEAPGVDSQIACRWNLVVSCVVRTRCMSQMDAAVIYVKNA